MIAALLAVALGGEFDGYVIPVAGADTDDGFGAGGRAELARVEEGYAPYKWSLMAHGYLSTNGYQHHRLRFDRTGLGAQRRLRVTAYAAWRAWKNDGYWGIGNTTTREQAFTGTFAADDLRRKRYRYELLQPFGYVTARLDLGESPWSVFGSVSPKWSSVETYAGSVLAEERPYGMAGGFAVQGTAGLLHDTRDPEIRPRKGHLFEASARATPLVDGEAGGFGGPLLSARAFAASGDRVVWAGRVVGEYLVGTVPFYEMVHWGGLVPMTGFGGFETIRGVSFGRWRAPGKVVANGELRLDAVRHRLGKAEMDWELAPFVDVGSVFGAGADGEGLPVHPGAGLGVRPVLDETFVGRFDAAFGLDPVTLRDGSVDQRPTFGFYMVFEHPF